MIKPKNRQLFPLGKKFAVLLPAMQSHCSALTGHVEGSRAFTRYRTIDIDMKKDLVKILEGGK